MIDKIRKLLKNKKTDAAFKRAGPGYRLNEASDYSKSNHSGASSCGSSSSASVQPSSTRKELTEESKNAAEAALARWDKQKNVGKKSLATIKAQVRQELEAEKHVHSASTATHSKGKPEVELEGTPLLAVQGVFFECPLLGPDVLTKEEWNHKIREFLYNELEEEKGLIACLIIHTLNFNREKVAACVNTIVKYLENILKYPNDEKYRKIRMSNKVFCEKVQPVEGALLILEAAGFEVKEELSNEGTVENFLVYPIEKLPNAPELFEILIDGLKNAEPITLELHRNLQVLLPTQAKERNELPSSFYNLTVEEIKREQFLRAEEVERNQTLRTKAMREKDNIQEIRRYKFALIRVRFPDGILLQGTFGVYEKVSSIITFVKETLDDENLGFTLTTPDGQHLVSNSEATLIDFKLVPAAIIIFTPDASKKTYFKAEILTLIESLTLS